MTRKKRLTGLFFDFDGVIVDSNRIKTEAFRTLFRDYSTEVVDEVVAYHRQHGGISRVEKIRHAHNNIIGKPLGEEDTAIWAEHYSQLVIEKVVLVPWIKGAKEFLVGLDKTLPVFVISGTPEPELKTIIERRKISDYFDEILGSPVKKPVHIKRVLNSYRLQPDNCLFIGDALTDYDAAGDTGLKFIGIQGEVQFPTGTTVLPDCSGLEEIIREWFIY